MRIPHRTPWVLGALAALLMLSSCGEGAQNRPVLVGSFPANNQVLSGGLSLIRLDYDEPVTLLNPESVRIIANGVSIPTDTFQVDGEPTSVYVVPEPQVEFIPGAIHSLSVIEGLVTNEDGHYAEEVQGVTFELGPAGPLALAAGGAVKLFNRETFALESTVPLPMAGTDSVAGVLVSQTATGRRYWVQRSDADEMGAGTAALAYFDEGDAAMTQVFLPTVGPGGSLHTTLPAMTLDPEGEFLYVAYRESPGSGLRFYRVDVDTLAVTGPVAAVASVATLMTPAGMDITLDRQSLLLAMQTGLAGELATIDLETLEPVDRDAGTVGTQHIDLPHPPRTITAFSDRWVSTSLDGAGTANAQQYLLFNGLVAETPSAVTGTGGDILRTQDFFIQLQTVTGYADDTGLVVRALSTGYATATPVTISDDVGGVDQGASSVIAATLLPGTTQFLVILDGGLIGRFFWDGFSGVFQEDLDDGTDGTQVIDGGADWADVTGFAIEFGQFPD